jgi:hypothetical protein
MLYRILHRADTGSRPLDGSVGSQMPSRTGRRTSGPLATPPLLCRSHSSGALATRARRLRRGRCAWPRPGTATSSTEFPPPKPPARWTTEGNSLRAHHESRTCQRHRPRSGRGSSPSKSEGGPIAPSARRPRGFTPVSTPPARPTGPSPTRGSPGPSRHGWWTTFAAAPRSSSPFGERHRRAHVVVPVDRPRRAWRVREGWRCPPGWASPFIRACWPEEALRAGSSRSRWARR